MVIWLFVTQFSAEFSKNHSPWWGTNSQNVSFLIPSWWKFDPYLLFDASNYHFPVTFLTLITISMFDHAKYKNSTPAKSFCWNQELTCERKDAILVTSTCSKPFSLSCCITFSLEVFIVLTRAKRGIKPIQWYKSASLYDSYTLL